MFEASFLVVEVAVQLNLCKVSRFSSPPLSSRQPSIDNKPKLSPSQTVLQRRLGLLGIPYSITKVVSESS
jgi:hypothetical protein